MEPNLDIPEPRSYVDLPTNVGLIAQLSATRNLGDFLLKKLPNHFLPVFLHEATHHWCFHSSLGFAMAALFERAAANSARFADACHGRASLAIHKRGRVPELEDAFHDVLRFDVACRLLMPLIEGLALFSEFDVQPKLELGSPFALGMASTLYAGWTPDKETNAEVEFGERLLSVRRTDQMVDRKHKVLLMNPTPSESPYLSGYLSVKSTWSAAASLCEGLVSSTAFATFMRNYFFEDLGLVSCLLKADVSGPNNEMPFASAFATRLRDRARDLLQPKTYEFFGAYKEALERSINEDHDPDEPHAPALSMTNAETVSAGWKAVREMIDEFELKSKDGLYWSAARNALAQRHVMTLDVAQVYVKIANGICSVWLYQGAKFPLITGATCLVPTANKKEGPGHLALLVPTQLSSPFIAIIMDGELMCDSLQSGIPAEVVENCRSAARDIPTKMQLSSMSQQNLDVLMRRVQHQYMTSDKILSPVLSEIYDGQAMPWLRRDERDDVMSHFLREGNGLAALFPKGKKHLLKAVTSLSLGVGYGVLLEEACNHESILDVINRINQMAHDTWHQGLIHVFDNDRCSTLV